jgi:protein-tyrosine phosphatase
MIDIHTHILPGVDDGAANWEETFAMARAAVAEGITTVIATPHHANGKYWNESEAVLELAEQANVRLEDEGIPLHVLTGQEIRVHDDLLDAWAQGNKLLSLAGSSYVLLEMPSGAIPRGMGELVHELQVMGLRTVIAHPERNAEVMSHPERFAALIEAGAYGQVTTHSLVGGFGKRIEQQAWKLCRQGLIQLVSSDAHHVERRGFKLREAYARIERQLGSAWRDGARMNGENLIHNLPLIAMDTIAVKETGIKRLFSTLFHKD